MFMPKLRRRVGARATRVAMTTTGRRGPSTGECAALAVRARQCLRLRLRLVAHDALMTPLTSS